MDAPTRDLMLALLLQALEVARNHGHHTLTFRAALGVAAFAARKVEHRPLSGRESPEEMAQLADLLRDIIRADPDEAGDVCVALESLKYNLDAASPPRLWRPTAAHIARAAQVLGVEPPQVHDTAFTKDGALYARVVCGDFVEIPLGQVNPAEEREDA